MPDVCFSFVLLFTTVIIVVTQKLVLQQSVRKSYIVPSLFSILLYSAQLYDFSFCLFACLSVYLLVCLFICLSFCLFACLSVYLLVCLFICIQIKPNIFEATHMGSMEGSWMRRITKKMFAKMFIFVKF